MYTRIVKEIKGFPFFFFYGIKKKRSGFFLLFSLVFWLSRGDVVVSFETFSLLQHTHTRWMDEREALVWKRRVDFIYFLFSACVSLNILIYFVLDPSEKRRDFSDDKEEDEEEEEEEERRKSSVKRPRRPFCFVL